MTAEEQELVGTTIAGKYRLGRLIGVGGMGSVYEGQHVDLEKRVAVKIIDSAGDASAELARRFKREARAASAVESENIVQVFDVGRDPNVGLYMVMELLDGEDLEMRLRREPGRRLDPVFVAQIGQQVARALVKAHGARVIHRDLKPANIFLTEREDGSLRVKILDFGISKLLASDASIATNKDGLLALTAAGVALGTPQYMSPEQAQGLTTVDGRTDVWGLGVVMYEALAGTPAYAELGSYQLTILKILQDKPLPLSRVAPWVPEALARVVHDAIEHDVGKRIQDCAAFAERIAEAMPEAVMHSTGPFGAAKKLARLSFPDVVAASVVSGYAPSKTTPNARRPISLGDDTQVVVRPSDPGAQCDDSDPSMTMLAPPSADRRRPRGIVVLAPGGAEEEQGPLSTGDPTMFQSPAWVAAPGDGPTTIKSGLALGAPGARADGRPLQMLGAAAVTAAAVIGVGMIALMLARGSDTSVGAAGAEPLESAPVALAVPPAIVATSLPAEPTPAPPATGTGSAPVAPATGAAPPPVVGVDASTASIATGAR
jgi:serine/threonine protein kinase